MVCLKHIGKASFFQSTSQCLECISNKNMMVWWFEFKCDFFQSTSQCLECISSNMDDVCLVISAFNQHSQEHLEQPRISSYSLIYNPYVQCLLQSTCDNVWILRNVSGKPSNMLIWYVNWC